MDDLRPAPEGYVWCKSANEVKRRIEAEEQIYFNHRDISDVDIISVISIGYDDRGDFIRILDWLEETGRNYPIRIHSHNSIGVQDMRRIIERSGWKEMS